MIRKLKYLGKHAVMFAIYFEMHKKNALMDGQMDMCVTKQVE